MRRDDGASRGRLCPRSPRRFDAASRRLRGPHRPAFKRWGILQANSVGVIDNSYCGTNDEWKLPVYATRDTVLEKGDRICQFRIYETQPPIEFEECDELSATDRGGFGSTGRK